MQTCAKIRFRKYEHSLETIHLKKAAPIWEHCGICLKSVSIFNIVYSNVNKGAGTVVMISD